MTIDEIIDMACALHVYEPCHLVADAERRLKELFEAIAAKEREACLEICRAHGGRDALEIAIAIKARSEK